MQTEIVSETDSPAFAHPRAEILYQDHKGIKKMNSRLTVAYRTVGNDIVYGVAFTSPRDNFSRKIGRAIAEGRLEKTPLTLTPVTLEHPLKTILGDIISNHLPLYWVSANLITER